METQGRVAATHLTLSAAVGVDGISHCKSPGSQSCGLRFGMAGVLFEMYLVQGMREAEVVDVGRKEEIIFSPAGVRLRCWALS